MGLFNKSDIPKSKYIIAIIADINAGKKIKIKNNKSVTFKKTRDIINLENVQTNPKKYMDILYPKQVHAPIFYDGKLLYRFIDIDKSQYSGMGGSRNSLGKKLADAGELATVLSLTKDIKSPSDTEQNLFVENPDAFLAWLPTFQYTKVAISKIVKGNISSYDILHDATDKSDFSKVISSFCKKVKIAKDSWNPADIFMIKRGHLKSITTELEHIVNNFEISDNLITIFNNKIYEFYLDEILYPISLKQLVTEKATIEYTNEPGKIQISHYNIAIHNINCNLGPDGKEIGLFTFKNNNTNKLINLQVRGFPHSYGTAQTEITSDGTPTGGRLGKISTSIIDSIMAAYNDERIKSISYFGKAPKYFSEFDENKINDVYDWYTTVISNNNVKNQNKITKIEFKNLIQEAKGNIGLAENLCMKIQGLKMMYFFIKNENKLSDIMNKMINGAKKISNDNGFFIKVY